MPDPLRERLASDAAGGALAPLEAYRRLFPGRDAEVERAWQEAGGPRTTDGSGPRLEDATRADVPLEALRETGAARLRLGPPLGAGGMGEVLEARDVVLRRALALKRVRGTGASGHGSLGDEEAALVRRLVEEAQITAQLDHPGVVPVHELGLDASGRPYFTMKQVHGQTLADVFRRDREGKGRTLARTLQVFLRLCETLAYAHRKGVVHRDVKPANVMVGRFGEVYLMDWGLAKLRGDAPEARGGAADGATGVVSTHRSERLRQGADAALTLDDQVVGTLGYLAPEQLVGAPVDARADVYAVGAMLYERLAGHAPYGEPDASDDVGRLLARMVKEPPAPLAARAPDAPPELVAIAEKALARDPDARFGSASELGEELHAYLEGRVVRSHRTGLWVELRKWVGRNRWLAAGLAAAVLASAGATAAFVAQQRRAAVEIGRERDRARTEAERAKAEGRRADGLRLAATSRLLVDDPGLALAVAVEAARRAPGPSATSALYHALRRHREERCFFGHDGYLSVTAWTSDGARLLTADETGSVAVRDVEADRTLRWLDGPTEPVLAVEVEPGDRRAAVVHGDGPVRVWDLDAGREVARLDVVATSAHWAAAGRLVVAGRDGAVEAWEPDGGRRTPLATGAGPARIGAGLAVGATRVAIVRPGRVTLLDVVGGAATELDAPAGGGEPKAVVGAAAGEVLVTWGPRDARAYDLATGVERRRVAPGSAVGAAAYAAVAGRLALAVQPERGAARVEVQDVATGAEVARVEVEAAVGLILARDGRSLVAVDRPHATWVELGATPRVVPLRGHRYTVAHASASPDGRWLATASHDLTARVWALRPADERTGVAERAAAGHRVLGWAADGSRALVALPAGAGAPTVLEVVESATGRVAGRFEAAGAPSRGGLDASRMW